MPARCEVEDFISCGLEALIAARSTATTRRRAPRSSSSPGPASTAPCSTSCAARTGRRARRRWERDIARAADRVHHDPGPPPHARRAGRVDRHHRRRAAQRREDVTRPTLTSLNTLVISDDETTDRADRHARRPATRRDPEHQAANSQAKAQVPPRVRHRCRSASARWPSCSTSRTSRCAEIGEIMGVSESRICQIHSQLKRTLKQQLSSTTRSSSPSSAKGSKSEADYRVRDDSSDRSLHPSTSSCPAVTPWRRLLEPGSAEDGRGFAPARWWSRPGRSSATFPRPPLPTPASSWPRRPRSWRRCTAATASCTSAGRDTNRVIIQVRDLEGNVIKTIPPSKALTSCPAASCGANAMAISSARHGVRASTPRTSSAADADRADQRSRPCRNARSRSRSIRPTSRRSRPSSTPSRRRPATCSRRRCGSPRRRPPPRTRRRSTSP